LQLLQAGFFMVVNGSERSLRIVWTMAMQNESSLPLIQSAKLAVLIATDDLHESSYIGEALEKQGYNVQFCEFNGRTLKGTPIVGPSAVLCVFSNYIEKPPPLSWHSKNIFFPKIFLS